VPTKQQRSATFFYTGKGEIQDVVNICDDFQTKQSPRFSVTLLKKSTRLKQNNQTLAFGLLGRYAED
jgi:hypothetical protein